MKYLDRNTKYIPEEIASYIKHIYDFPKKFLTKSEKDCIKKVKEELIPLYLYAKQRSAKFIQYTGIDCSCRYDGILFFDNSEEYVEITTMIDYRKEDLLHQLAKKIKYLHYMAHQLLLKI